MIAAVLAAVVTAADAIAAPTVITLREHAVVTHGYIRLGDIAAVGGVDAAERARLETVKIAPAPTPGARRTLTRKDVEQNLARVAGTLPVGGADAVTVERTRAQYDGASFVDAARAHLAARLGREHPELSRIEVAALADFPALHGPGGDWRMRARSSGDLAKRMQVWVDLEIDGAVYRSVPLWLAVSAYRPVIVARRAYRFKEPLARADFAVEERDIAGSRDAPLALDATIAGTRARRALAAGQIVHAADVEARPSVLAEQEIDVRVLAGPIAIDARAIAEQEGAVGEVIRVRNPTSALTYTARIVDEGKALIAER